MVGRPVRHWRRRATELFARAFIEGDQSAPRVDVDVVQWCPAAGLTISYSAASAEWLAAVAERPHDAALISGHLCTTLADGCSPIGGLLGDFAHLFVVEHGPAAPPTLALPFGSSDAEAALADAIDMLTEGAVRLLEIVSEVYTVLREPAAAAAARDAIHTVLFEQCAGALTPLLHDALLREDTAVTTQMEVLAAVHPRHLGLDARFWLDELGVGADCEPRTALPYAASIAILGGMSRLASPRAKLRCFLDACEEATRGVSSRPGADELIPIMAYALVRARVPHAASQLRLVESFVTADGELNGPMGYGLATMHAAIRLVASLTWDDEGAAAVATLPCTLSFARPPPSPTWRGGAASARAHIGMVGVPPPLSPSRLSSAAREGAAWLGEVRVAAQESAQRHLASTLHATMRYASPSRPRPGSPFAAAAAAVAPPPPAPTSSPFKLAARAKLASTVGGAAIRPHDGGPRPAASTPAPAPAPVAPPPPLLISSPPSADATPTADAGSLAASGAEARRVAEGLGSAADYSSGGAEGSAGAPGQRGRRRRQRLVGGVGSSATARELRGAPRHASPAADSAPSDPCRRPSTARATAHAADRTSSPWPSPSPAAAAAASDGASVAADPTALVIGADAEAGAEAAGDAGRVLSPRRLVYALGNAPGAGSGSSPAPPTARRHVVGVTNENADESNTRGGGGVRVANAEGAAAAAGGMLAASPATARAGPDSPVAQSPGTPTARRRRKQRYSGTGSVAGTIPIATTARALNSPAAM